MLCSDHLTARPSPLCIDSLTIGTISAVSTAVNVMFHNTATGSKIILPATSSIAGLITVDVSDVEFIANVSHIVTVALASTDVTAYLDVTINSETAKEVYLHFEDYGGEYSPASHTLSLVA
jgi:hypothetical protein